MFGGKRKKELAKEDEESGLGAKSKKIRQSSREEEFYIPYRPKDFDSERG